MLGTLSGAGTQFVSGQASATYNAGATPGAGSADATADGQTVTASITVTAPDLTVTKTHTGNFTQGQTGATYTIKVTNSGTACIQRHGQHGGYPARRPDRHRAQRHELELCAGDADLHAQRCVWGSAPVTRTSR